MEPTVAPEQGPGVVPWKVLGQLVEGLGHPRVLMVVAITSEYRTISVF